jgi:hypothetical protein
MISSQQPYIGDFAKFAFFFDTLDYLITRHVVTCRLSLKKISVFDAIDLCEVARIVIVSEMYHSA